MARLGRAAPGIPVSNIDRALGFYVDVLGFKVTFTNGDPVGFVILERDGAEVHLTLQRAHTATTANVCHIMVDDAAQLYELLVTAGVRVVKRLRDADYGMRGFVIADPDGNRIDFGQDL